MHTKTIKNNSGKLILLGERYSDLLNMINELKQDLKMQNRQINQLNSSIDQMRGGLKLLTITSVSVSILVPILQLII